MYTEVDTLILKHGNRSMKALYVAMMDKDNLSIEIPMAIVMDQRCGIERATEAADELKLNPVTYIVGATPLIMAVCVGRVDVAKYLIAAGANFDAVDNVGQTPLHIAVRSGQFKAVEALVMLGANLNAADKGCALHNQNLTNTIRP
eukprot:GDKK01028104.1.p1 GENE.GDKK01028104.1~~GDKK01028104.1.p1  ORF type:complete len:146 (+),score=7.15 GDKK01028104.1:76-513(+)